MRQKIFLIIKIKGQCWSSPCQNGGSCTDNTDASPYYECDCTNAKGYTGDNCEIRK
jgi:EYS protein